jgi:tetratricopeptide (TPR) repeat protein
LRVTAQLVNAEDGYQLWSKRFDRDLSDVFAIQDEVAATIVHELRSGLSREPAFIEATTGKPPSAGLTVGKLASAEPMAGERGTKRAASDLAAHDSYLKGMYALNKWTDESTASAIAEFREAIARDPRFAPAYTALAEAQLFLYSSLGILPAKQTVPEAQWAVDKAMELDGTLADAHRVRAAIAMNHDWDRRGAAEAIARALELGPGSAAAHLRNAWRLALFERQHDRALLELEEAERLDPLDFQLKTQIGYVHWFHRDVDRAIAQFERVLALEPSFAFAHYALGDAFTQRGQYDRAFAEFDKSIELGGRTVNHIGVLGYAHARSGNRDRAHRNLQELTARAADGYVSAVWTSLIYLGLSDHENVFRWLDRAFEERDGSLVLITGALEFDPVREDPRFKSLLDRMGLGHLA